VWPPGRAEEALRRCDDVKLPEPSGVWFPDPVIVVRRMHHQNRRPGSLVEVRAVDHAGRSGAHYISEMRWCSLRARLVSRSPTRTEHATVALSSSIAMTCARSVMSPLTGIGSNK